MNRPSRPSRLRRCELAVPGSSDRMIEKAAAMDVDMIFLDLEDSVAPAEKDNARERVIKALGSYEWKPRSICVRINDLETPHAYRDIIDLVERAGDKLDLIMVPKVRRAADVQWVDVLLKQIEARTGLKKRIGLEVLIEEVEAMMRVEEIAASCDRLEALILGFGDYSGSQGVPLYELMRDDPYPGDIWHYARNKVVVAARAYGIDAIDGPYSNIRDGDAYRIDANRGRMLGFVGKWALHPSQVAIANEVFSPKPEEVARARKIEKALREAQARGQGAIEVDGEFADAASMRLLQPILDLAAKVGM